MTARVLTAVALAGAFAAVAAAQSQAKPENPDFTGRFSVEEQYDDNVNFGDGTVTPEVDDWVTRLRPYVSYLHPYEDHLFSVTAEADYRKGADSGLSDLNADVSGKIDLNFGSGLGFVLFDTFTTTRFDQALFSEIGTTDSDSNVVGATLKYTKVDRLHASLRYEHLDQNFNSDATGDRSRNTVNGRFSVPVARRWAIYGDYLYEKQESPTRIERRYDDNRAVGGLRFKGAARVTIFGEGGYEEIHYDDPRQPDFENPVVNAGVEVQFSDQTSGRFSIGQDGYETTVFLASLDYHREDDYHLRLLASRSTRDSFAVGALSSIYEGTIFSFSGSTRLGHKFTLGGEGAYFLYRPVGDQLFLDADTFSMRTYLLYDIQEWLKVGGHYQYADRSADTPADEFSVNRAGGTIEVVW